MEDTVQNGNAESKYNKWIVVLSVAIPLVVAALFGVNLKKLGYKRAYGSSIGHGSLGN